ncbi:hypothetical protein [Palleronia sp.]|uniref:hypothetical protein n=1 Tax=Palleronia sp. TaxID=1940284 RepID=UPI0035C80CED
MKLEVLSIFCAEEAGGLNLDWMLQLALITVVCAGVLSSVTTGDGLSSTGNTHYNGYTITSQYP